MQTRRIEVECYAGGRADERPRLVRAEGREYRVARLLASSIEESAATRARRQRFRLLAEDGTVLVILRDENGEWYLESVARPPR